MTLAFAASAGQPAVGSGGEMRRVGMQESPHQQNELLTVHAAAPPAPFRDCQSFAVFAWLVLCWWVVGGGPPKAECMRAAAAAAAARVAARCGVHLAQSRVEQVKKIKKRCWAEQYDQRYM